MRVPAVNRAAGDDYRCEDELDGPGPRVDGPIENDVAGGGDDDSEAPRPIDGREEFFMHAGELPDDGVYRTEYRGAGREEGGAQQYIAVEQAEYEKGLERVEAVRVRYVPDVYADEGENVQYGRGQERVPDRVVQCVESCCVSFAAHKIYHVSAIVFTAIYTY
jgi:hypothetical protein